MVDVDKRANDNDADLPAGFKMTELGPLPEEWKVVKLGEIGEVTAGGSAPQERYYFNGRHPFVRVQHLDEDGYWVRRWDLITDEAVQAYRLRFFPKGTIVLPKSGASIRLEKRAVLPVDAYIVSHLCAVIPNSKAVDQRYLFYALKVRKFSSEKVEGYPTLNLSEIRNALIPLPPLSEQRAIAHVLRTVQRAKEATERVIQATQELKKSLMYYLFTYGSVPIEEAEKVPLKNVPVSLYGDMSTVQGTAAVRTKLVIKDITENLEYTEIIEDYSIGSTGSKTFSGDSYSPTKDVYLRGGHSYIVYVYIATSVDCGLDWSSAKSDFYGTGLGIVYSRIRLIF